MRWMYFVFKYENRRMKPVKIFLRRGKGRRGRTMQGVNLRYVVSTYANIPRYLPVQLLYANKIFKKVKKKKT
jgi:hypothetical protein